MMGNDVLFINLGPGADPGPNWKRYHRYSKHKGHDDIGMYDYMADDSSCSDNFKQNSCKLLSDVALDDPTWKDWWFFRIGRKLESEKLIISSVGQTAYVAFRAFVASGDPSIDAFGFRAEYTLGICGAHRRINRLSNLFYRKRYL